LKLKIRNSNKTKNMKLKHLQSALSSIPIKQFPNPKIILEQYATSPELASHVIQFALDRGDIGPASDDDSNDGNHDNSSNSILDLGCGTGMLSIGCAIVGTKLIYCVDCDEEAIEIVKENVKEMELEAKGDDEEEEDNDESESGCVFEFILAQVKHESNISRQNNTQGNRNPSRGKGGGKGGRGKGRGGRAFTNTSSHYANPVTITLDPNNEDDGIPLPSKCVTTVMTNPPFGTKHNAGIDVTFLKTAIRLATKAVYSFHKSSTSSYLIRTINSWGYEAEVVAQMKFDIPKMYKFHKKDEVDVEVDLIRVNVESVQH
jgi:predicted RNA methylase